MAAMGEQLIGVHLVGSVPLDSTEQVFRTASSMLGERLRRLPDGETGVRTNWIGWQAAVFQAHPDFEIVPPASLEYAALPRFRLRSGATADTLRFANLGYADAARESYALFARLKQEGVIPASYRFQVSLPTPLAPVIGFVDLADQLAVLQPYTARMLDELNTIAATVPHDQLAIQWDVAVEFGMLEGVWQSPFQDTEGALIARLIDLGNAVPPDVELGYHLCYGDAGHKHFKEPLDTSRLVSIANAISAGVVRPINWIHLPVPRDRTDEAYFAPLRDLRLHPETELYLGLVHHSDGVEGTRRRIETAQRVVARFGVATECGMGRRPPETIDDLLHTHAAVS